MTGNAYEENGRVAIENGGGAFDIALHDMSVVVEKSGLPVVVLVSYREFEEIRRLAGLQALNQAVRTIGPIAEEEGWTEEGIAAEVDKAKREVVTKKYGRRRKH